MNGMHRRRRVPVPGLPSWAGYADVHEVGGVDGPPVKLFTRVHVYPVRFAAWRVGCAVGHATLGFWRSLYDREDRRTVDTNRRGGLPRPTHQR